MPHFETKAIIQRGLIEHQQIINISSNRRIKQLDTGMLTYLLLSNGTPANGDHSCPVQRCFEDFTSHQLDLRRPTVHANLALKSERSARVTRGTYRQVLTASNPASQHTCFSPCSYSSAATIPTEWQLVPATRVTLLVPGKECERDRKRQKPNMSPSASPNHSTQTKSERRGLTKSHYDPHR